MRKLFLLFACAIVCVNCTSKNDVPVFSDLEIDSSMQIAETTQVIDKPIAVEAFFLHDWLTTPDAQDSDSTAAYIERNRQKYYAVTNGRGYYNAQVRPLLDSLGITRWTAADSSQHLVFVAQDSRRYSVKLRDLEQRSGILLFNGQGKPLYWEDPSTNGWIEDFIRHYYAR